MGSWSSHPPPIEPSPSGVKEGQVQNLSFNPALVMTGKCFPPKPEQCQRKPATTEGLKLDTDYHNITPQIFTFQPKEIHHTKDQEGLKFNEKRKSLKLKLRLQRC